MPFDASPDAEVTARDRMIRLRDFLAALPDDRFDIRYAWRGMDGGPCSSTEVVARPCGTAACISGWAQILFNSREPVSDLGLTSAEADELFAPPGYDRARNGYTRERAVAVLDHYLATGEMSWEAALSAESLKESGR